MLGRKLRFYTPASKARGFPGSSVVKNSLVNAGNTGLSSGLGRYPGEGNGNPLFPGKPMDRGAGRLPSMVSQRVRHDLETKQ